MLRSLRIKHLALVDELRWEPGPGFTVITGETGAGKSVLIGALSLVLGDRADRTLIRTGADSCSVEAEWDLSGLPITPALNALLDEAGVDPCEDSVLLLKRTLSAAGQNRQFINGCPATLATLKQVGDRLADFHGPHDHQSLLSADTQRDLLDAFGGAGPAVAACRDAFHAWRDARTAHDTLASEMRASAAELDLLEHQVGEIERASLTPGEDTRLAATLDGARHGVRLLELAGQVQSLLTDGEPSAADLLGSADRALADMAALDPRAAAFHDSLAAAQTTLSELARDLAHYADRVDLDPGRLSELEARYDLLQTLKRRHGPALDDVLRHAADGRARLERIANRDAELAAAAARVDTAAARLADAARTLTTARRAAATRLAKSVTAELKQLGFQKASLGVDLRPLPEPAAHGADAVEFQFAPNPGEGSKPLRSIASSGEMARVMLAL